MATATQGRHYINPKIIQYRANGTGRDSYIARGNASLGFESSNISSSKFQITGEQIHLGEKGKNWNFSSSLTSGFRPASSGSQSKPVTTNKYYNNGSGRDNYVSDTMGGIVKNYVDNFSKKAFEKQLRNYGYIQQPEEYFKRIDCAKTGQLWRTGKEYQYQQKLTTSQSSLNKRLSKPKRLMKPQPIQGFPLSYSMQIKQFNKQQEQQRLKLCQTQQTERIKDRRLKNSQNNRPQSANPRSYSKQNSKIRSTSSYMCNTEPDIINCNNANNCYNKSVRSSSMYQQQERQDNFKDEDIDYNDKYLDLEKTQEILKTDSGIQYDQYNKVSSQKQEYEPRPIQSAYQKKRKVRYLTHH